MSTAEDPHNPMPRNFDLVKGIVRKLVEEERAIPQAMVFESLLGTSLTAHILGGAAIGKDAESGVIDGQHRVYGYENLLVCDGAAFPANPGVNPGLTITALAERAMTFVPDRAG